MQASISSTASENDSILRWGDLKKHFPDAARGVVSEYLRVKGQIPYEIGYVYLIHAKGTPHYKIGKSVAPDKRILQISPKMPFETELIKSWGANFMSIAESWLHSDFSDFRVNGEWFNLPDDYLYCLLTGFEAEYASTIRNAYLTTVTLGLCANDLNSLSESLSNEFKCGSIGLPYFGHSGHTIALLEQWFYEIKHSGDAPSFTHSPSLAFLERLNNSLCSRNY